MMEPAYRSSKRVALGALSLGTVLALWFVLTATVVPALRFPAPAQVWESVSSQWGAVLESSFATWARVAAGLVLGSLYGIFNGLMLSRSRLMFALGDPVIEILRPIPPIAATPFFILWFGLGEVGKVLLIAFGCSTVLLVATLDAVRQVPPQYIQAASTLGAESREIYRTVIWPAIMPTVFSALRVAAAISFTLGIAAEFMGAQTGLGYMIMLAGRTLNTSGMVAGIILIGLLSFLTDRAIRLLRARTLAWMEDTA